MGRRDLVASLVDLRSRRGLEIGPLDRPLVARSDGPVEYVDRASRAGLQAAYAGHADVGLTRIPEIDHVWGEQSLLDCVGGERAYDYVLASHVIEHVPDVFGWLGEIASVLADGGLAIFFVPDKRYTFDALRPVSAPGEFVDAYVRRLRRPDVRQIFNHIYQTRELGAAPPDEAALTERARQGLDVARRAQSEGAYHDVHCWVFTPASLVAALDLASRLDLLPFEVAAVRQGADEFLVALRRLPADAGAEARRQAFLASLGGFAVEDEAADGEEAALLRAQLQVARARGAAIENSTIWRMTAPLRRIAAIVRRRG